jgi:sugar phosphate isomerase/epimerase
MAVSRREFLAGCAAVAATAPFGLPGSISQAQAAKESASNMQLGLVTYNWGKDWDIETIIKNCSATGFKGVELRSTHKHGVEITLGKQQRKEVRARFADSDVELVGLGSACEYHSNDPAVVKKNIEETKAFVDLCHDVGGTGVKVRPNGFPKGVEQEKTLAQIGRSLNEVAEYGARYGVQIRLEVHGRGTAELPHIRSILDVADNRNTVVCWNCNPTDLNGEGLVHNFELVADRIGTVHIHDLRNDAYPWKQLFSLLKGVNFSGWTLLEDGKVPDDIVKAMHENRKVWDGLAG